jgi:hypothetical protein
LSIIHFVFIIEINIFLLDITKSCDCVLWAGDMNFRVEMLYEEVLEHCKQQDFSEILLNDEFRGDQKETGKGKLFNKAKKFFCLSLYRSHIFGV